jgi:hypothetical protein
MGTAVLLVGGAFAITRIWRRLALGSRVMVAGISVLLPLLGVLSFFALSGNPIRRELTGLTVVRLFTEVYDRAFELLVPAAIAIWRDNPVFGVGGWGFRHFVPLYLTPEQYKKLFVGAANVHNDIVNFLVEHGIVGAALLVLAGVALLVPLALWIMTIHVPMSDNIHAFYGKPAWQQWLWDIAADDVPYVLRVFPSVSPNAWQGWPASWRANVIDARPWFGWLLVASFAMAIAWAVWKALRGRSPGRRDWLFVLVWLVVPVMLLVALSRRICCSRVCSARRMAG